VGALTLSERVGPAVGTGIVASMLSPAVSIWNDFDDEKESKELDALSFSDLLPAIKRKAIEGIEFAHNATFSNGIVGDKVGTTVRLLCTIYKYYLLTSGHIDGGVT